MVWKALNFHIRIPGEFCDAAAEVCPPSEKSRPAEKPKTITVKFFHGSFSRSKMSFTENTLIRSCRSATLVAIPPALDFLCFLEKEHHPPLVLSSLLLKLVKLIGLRFDTVLLHAACVVENGRAILIPGKEGRGKTTLSRNLPGVAVVNDDLSLVLLDPASGRFCAYRVPDPENLDGKTPFAWEGPWPLSTIVFPRRERPRGIYRLTPQEAFTHGTEEGPAFLDADGFLEFHSAHKLYNRFMKRLFGGTACVSVSYRPGEDSDLLARLLEGEEYR